MNPRQPDSWSQRTNPQTPPNDKFSPRTTDAPQHMGLDEQYQSQDSWTPANNQGYRPPSKPPSVLARVIIIIVGLLLVAGLMAWGYKSYSRLTSPVSLEERQRAEIEEGRQMRARDTERFVELHSIQAQLEYYYEKHKYYPSLEQINAADVRKKEFANLDGGNPIIFTDPSSKSAKMTSSLEKGRYMYETEPSRCDNITTKCTYYVLGAYKETNPKAYYRLPSLN